MVVCGRCLLPALPLLQIVLTCYYKRIYVETTSLGGMAPFSQKQKKQKGGDLNSEILSYSFNLPDGF